MTADTWRAIPLLVVPLRVHLARLCLHRGSLTLATCLLHASDCVDIHALSAAQTLSNVCYIVDVLCILYCILYCIDA